MLNDPPEDFNYGYCMRWRSRVEGRKRFGVGVFVRRDAPEAKRFCSVEGLQSSASGIGHECNGKLMANSLAGMLFTVSCRCGNPERMPLLGDTG